MLLSLPTTTAWEMPNFGPENNRGSRLPLGYILLGLVLCCVGSLAFWGRSGMLFFLCLLSALRSGAAVTQAYEERLLVLPLIHRPLVVSAERWGTNETQTARRLEADEVGQRVRCTHPRRLRCTRCADHGGREAQATFSEKTAGRCRHVSDGIPQQARVDKVSLTRAAYRPPPKSESPLFEGIGTHYAHIYVG